MWRVILFSLLLVGCAQLPPTPQDVSAKQFQSLPDRAVVYIVRQPMDSREASALTVDDGPPITTLSGTYFRLELTPGVHRIAGYAGANELVTLNAEPGKIYFLEHTVIGTRRSGPQFTALRQIGEEKGRQLVLHSRLL
jgi:hypothetical protein